MSERTSHWGDCTFYSSLVNGMPWDGICTCGYGWTLWARDGDLSQMLSEERRTTPPPVPRADADRLAEALARALVIVIDVAETHDEPKDRKIARGVRDYCEQALAAFRAAHPPAS